MQYRAAEAVDLPDHDDVEAAPRRDFPKAGKVDCVVVYKVDRLSRSIRDFAKIMEIFEKHGTTFVSVTKEFDTTSTKRRRASKGGPDRGGTPDERAAAG